MAILKDNLKPSLESRIKDLIREEGADFIDFGCSSGGSLTYAMKTLGGTKGIGIDIDDKKVAKTKAAGFLALHGDLTTIRPLSERVRFVIMSHILEHIPSIKDVKNCIRSAVNSSKDFIYIQQPYFDSDPLFMEHGLKTYWSDWHGHPNRMTSLEFHNILNPMLKEGLIVRFMGENRLKKVMMSPYFIYQSRKISLIGIRKYIALSRR
jgi:SAM-dependent methyltransferase